MNPPWRKITDGLRQTRKLTANDADTVCKLQIYPNKSPNVNNATMTVDTHRDPNFSDLTQKRTDFSNKALTSQNFPASRPEFRQLALANVTDQVPQSRIAQWIIFLRFCRLFKGDCARGSDGRRTSSGDYPPFLFALPTVLSNSRLVSAGRFDRVLRCEE